VGKCHQILTRTNAFLPLWVKTIVQDFTTIRTNALNNLTDRQTDTDDYIHPSSFSFGGGNKHGMWSRSRHLGLETVSRRTKVSSRPCKLRQAYIVAHVSSARLQVQANGANQLLLQFPKCDGKNDKNTPTWLPKIPFVSDTDPYLWCSMVFTVHLAKVLRAATSRLGLGAMRLRSRLSLGLKGLVHIHGNKRTVLL